jgi:hypothetical protein
LEAGSATGIAMQFESTTEFPITQTASPHV